MSRPRASVVFATLVLLSLIWGTTWAAIRIGLAGVPPFAGVSLRFGIAAVVLLIVGRLLGARFERSRRETVLWIVNGLLSFCASYGVVYWAEQWVPSGLAAVLFATFPLFVAILAHLSLPDERLTARGALGIIAGFGGVAVIFSEDFAHLGGPGVAVASAVMLVSPAVSAVASVAIKKWGKGVHPVSITAVPMAIGALVMGGLSLAAEGDRPLVWTAPAVGALLYLALAGSAVTFTLYYWLLSHIPATRVALIAYTTPVVAVSVGALFLHEPYTLRMLVGTAMVLGGVALAVRPPRRIRPAAAAVLALVVASVPASASSDLLLIPGDDLPPAVEALGPPANWRAFALSEDGTAAAAAEVVEEGSKKRKKLRSILRVAGPRNGEMRETRLDGTVRALRFGPDLEGLYALVLREPTRFASGESTLVRLDLDSLKAARDIRVPMTARAFDLAADGAALLVACRDEIRVVLIPDLGSPRLFRVPGENGALAAIPGTERVLLGQEDGIALVDLSDRPLADGLPVRARVELPAPVADLAAASDDGWSALARLADGSTYRVTLDPLRLDRIGITDAVTRIGTPTAPPPDAAAKPSREAAPPPPPVSERAPAEPPPREPPASPRPEPPEEIAASAPPAAPPPQSPAAARASAEPGASGDEVGPETDARTPPPEPISAEAVRGRITGPAASEVRWVVLLGPDNLLREAARVAPQPDGSWSCGPLPPGAYRLVLDAGGDRTVVSDPPFGSVSVRGESRVTAQEMRVLKVMNP